MPDPAPHPTPPQTRRLVIFCNELTPFRIHWHRRIAAEIPGLRLTTVLFPHRWEVPWLFAEVPGIGLVRFEPRRPAGIRSTPSLRVNSRLREIVNPRTLLLRGRSAFAEFTEAVRVVRLLSRDRPAALVVTGYHGIGEKTMLVWSKLAGVPSFVWGDSNIKSDKAAGPRLLYKKLVVGFLLRCARGMLACGSLGLAFYCRYRNRPDLVFFCPNEPDYAEIENLPVPLIEETRQRFSLNPARKRFIAVARLVALKRIDTLIDAFARIADRRPDWDLLIVGDGPERAALESRIPAPLRARVTITGFITDQAHVSACYRLAHAFVHPSENEAWGVVINEAAAAGLPLVVSDVTGAAPELVREGRNGRVFQPGDIDALAACLLDVSSEERRVAMGAASRDVLDEWRRTADPVEGLRKALRSAGLDAPSPTSGYSVTP